MEDKMYGPNPLGISSLLRVICRWPVLLVVTLIVGATVAWPGQEKPGCCEFVQVSFTFDDGYESTFTKAYPILESYGFQGTAFVITSMVGRPGYMTLDQLKKLYESNWDIGSHTVTHRVLTKIPLNEVEKELADSRTWLKANGFEVYSFASPEGEYNNQIIELIKKYYTLHRTAWPKGLNPIPLVNTEDVYRLKNVEVRADTSVEEVKGWIDKAIEEHAWLILSFHRIDANDEFSWSSINFEEIVRYVRDKRGVPLTIKSLK
jgi:peptidoglycan/xylan/chitin deacetylase (PgdA/CDA1 family)